MAKIRSKQVVPGMVLSRDVHDSSGRLLAKKGTEIEGKHIKVFNTWGVAELEIDNDDAGNEHVVEIPEEYLHEARKQLNRNLMHNDLEHELIKEIFTIAVDKLALELMNGDKS